MKKLLVAAVAVAASVASFSAIAQGGPGSVGGPGQGVNPAVVQKVLAGPSAAEIAKLITSEAKRFNPNLSLSPALVSQAMSAKGCAGPAPVCVSFVSAHKTEVGFGPGAQTPDVADIQKLQAVAKARDVKGTVDAINALIAKAG